MRAAETRADPAWHPQPMCVARRREASHLSNSNSRLANYFSDGRKRRAKLQAPLTLLMPARGSGTQRLVVAVGGLCQRLVKEFVVVAERDARRAFWRAAIGVACDAAIDENDTIGRALDLEILLHQHGAAAVHD